MLKICTVEMNLQTMEWRARWYGSWISSLRYNWSLGPGVMRIIPAYNQFKKLTVLYDKSRYLPVPKYSCTIWEGVFPVLFTSLYCTRKAAVDWNTADSVREKCDWVLSSPWMAFGGKPSVVLQRRQQSRNPCHRGDMMRCYIHQSQDDKWFIQKLNARTHASSQ